MRRSISALVIFLALTGSASAQLPPDQALKAFNVADGLQIELFASEPMFVNPTCFDIDHKGRVWVCESVNYRCDLRKQPRNRKEGDRLVVLEDTDADGKADKATTFYQAPDFLAPLGVCVAPEPDGKGMKVYVCHSPHIYLFEDKDGDLKADGPPTIILTGFKGYDHDHGVHGIHIGTDGKLYFSVGDQGVDGLVDRHGKTWKSNNSDCRAGTIWRCDLDGKNLELIAHNFRNPYEPAVDSFGTVFTSDNDDDGNQQTRICYVMPGGNYGYHPRGPGQSHWHEEQPGVVHKVLRTGFGSPTGMCWYEGTLIPFVSRRASSAANAGASANHYGCLLHTDAGPREVRCFFVKPKGAGYELEQLNLVTSTDNWFRPADVCVAPDGSIFVADWYDPGVGGHGMGDTTRGRIYRLTPKGHQGYKVPEVDLSKDEPVVSALDSPNFAMNQSARAYLRSQTRDKIVSILSPVVENKQVASRLLVRSLWELARLQPSDSAAWVPIGKQMPWRDGSFREFAVRLLRDWGNGSDEPAGYTAFFGNDSDPRSRREVLVSLRDVEPQKAASAFWHMAKLYDGRDHFYLAAINIAVGTDPNRREGILADFEKHFPEWNEKVAGLVRELRPPGAIKTIGQRLNNPKTPGVEKVQLVDILAVLEGADSGSLLLKLVSADGPAELRAAVLRNLQTHLPAKWSALRQDPELKAAIDRLLAKPGTRVEAINLIAAAERVDFLDALIELAKDEEETTSIRAAAAHGLAALKSDSAVKALVELLNVDLLRREAVLALGKLATPAALAALQGIVKDDKQPLDTREAAIGGLASSRPGTQWLLDAQGKRALAEALVPETGWVLRNSRFPDLRNRALVAFPAPERIDPKKRIDVHNLPKMRRLVSSRGDAGRGRNLFMNSKDLACNRCHALQGQGGGTGPDLSLIGKKASRDNLFESLLFPDRAVADQFLQYALETKEGQILVGIIVEESATQIVIRDALGKDTRIANKDIESRARSPKSIMPGDLVAYLTEQDLVDIVEYLSNLKEPLLTVDYWFHIGPFDNDDKNSGKDKVFPPEKEIKLEKSYPGKGGAIHWRAVKSDPNGYANLQVLLGAKSDYGTFYLYREVEAPADHEAMLYVGVDDFGKLWVNGKQIYNNTRGWETLAKPDVVPVSLKKGLNTFLLKVVNTYGGAGGLVHISSEQEVKLVQPPGFRPDAWQVIGPFDNPPDDKGIDIAYPPEKKLDLQTPLPGKGGMATWRTVAAGPDGFVDLRKAFAPAFEWMAAYAYREIESPVAQDATLWLGSDDKMKVWVNGQLAFEHKTSRGAAPMQDVVKVKLKSGPNRLLLKVTNGKGDSGFYLTILSGQPVKAR